MINRQGTSQGALTSQTLDLQFIKLLTLNYVVNNFEQFYYLWSVKVVLHRYSTPIFWFSQNLTIITPLLEWPNNDGNGPEKGRISLDRGGVCEENLTVIVEEKKNLKWCEYMDSLPSSYTYRGASSLPAFQLPA